MQASFQKQKPAHNRINMDKHVFGRNSDKRGKEREKEGERNNTETVREQLSDFPESLHLCLHSQELHLKSPRHFNYLK